MSYHVTRQLPSDVPELANQGITAIRNANDAAYIELLITSDELREACPILKQKLAPRLVEEIHESVHAKMAHCAELCDFRGAREISHSIPRHEELITSCGNGGNLLKLDDIKFEFDVNGEVIQVTLDDPVRVGDVYAFAGDPKCRKVSPSR